MRLRVITLSAILATTVTALVACQKQAREPNYTPASRTLPEPYDPQMTQPQSLGNTETGNGMKGGGSAAETPSGSAADTWGSGSGSDANPGASPSDMNAAAPETGGSVSGGVGEPSSFAVTRARCDREIRCKNVGTGKKYETREDCVRDLNKNDSDMFGSNVCANGVDQDQLNRCLNTIRNESCKTSLDQLDMLNTCQATKVCKK